MKKAFYLCLTLFLLLQTSVPVLAEKINSRKNLQLAEKILSKIDSLVEEEKYLEADKEWKSAFRLIKETYSDTTKLNRKTLTELEATRNILKADLYKIREKIDAGIIQLKIHHGEGEEALEYLKKTLNSDFYEGVETVYIGNSYFQTGKFFLEEQDYENTLTCYLKAIDYYERSLDYYSSSDERKVAKKQISELLDSLFDLYLVQGDYVKANEVLTTILKKERSYYSETTERYRKYSEIKETFPMYVLTESYKTKSPQESFKQFVALVDGPYGKKLSATEKNNYYVQAASFFEKKSQPELIAECEKKQMEMFETSLDGKVSRPEQEKILSDYNQLMQKNLEKAEQNKDFKTIFEVKKKTLEQNKAKFGENDPRILQECRENMDYFLNLGDKKSARFFYEDFSQIREQAKIDSLALRNRIDPFTFFENDLSNYAQKYNIRRDLLYEPNRQKNENTRRLVFAPQGNVDKEFRFWDLYNQFIQKQDEEADEAADLADAMFEMIKDPVFQQFEYFQPILKLGTYFHQNKQFKEATYCANLSEDIVSFFSDPDAPENFFPILLRAAVLNDSGDEEGANRELQHLISYGILQRMVRLSLMNGNDDDSILNTWPFGNLNSNMNSKCQLLIDSAERIPDSVFSEKIECYQPGTNPIPFVLQFANQYEKAGQYTQAMLLYMFSKPFYQSIPESMTMLQERIDTLEKKKI